jgi:large subunit ribosomal protein LP2
LSGLLQAILVSLYQRTTRTKEMKHLAAYMLIALSGKEPTADGVAALLSKVDVEVDKEKIDLLFKSLEGKTIGEVIKEGQGKLLAVGGARGGGGGSAPAAGGAAPAAGGAAPAKKEEKKEEKEVEVDMGGGNLFGADEKGGDGVSYLLFLFLEMK